MGTDDEQAPKFVKGSSAETSKWSLNCARDFCPVAVGALPLSDVLLPAGSL